MIHKVSFKNFCSIKGRADLSFEVDGKAPKNDSYVEVNGSRLSKVEVIIGANASGKTNIMKVLPFLRWILVDSFNSDPNAQIPVQPFVFSSMSKKPSEFSVDFELNGVVYTYVVDVTQELIKREYLAVKSKSVKRTTTKKLFERTWNKDLDKYDFDAKKYGFPISISDLLRKNSSVIASAIRLNHKLSQEISDYWRSLETNVGMIGYMEDEGNIIQALLAYHKDETLKRKVEKILSRFDLGLSELTIIKKDAEQGKMSLGALVTHVIDGKKYNLSLKFESSGTQKLVSILRPILKVLASGGIAILDEIDVNLHPDIVSTILSLFVNKNINPKNAQFLFSTHSHIVLNELDKYQVNLAQKNVDGGTVMWRLDQNKDIVRSDENLFVKYTSGAYGAVPEIKL